MAVHTKPNPTQPTEPARLSRRLLIAGASFLAAAVPVTVLGYAATHGWVPLRSLDQGVADSLHAWAVRTPGAVSFLEAVSRVIDPWVLRAGALVAVAVLVVRGRRRLALWVAATIVGAGVLGYVLKELLRRTRPDLPDAVATAPGYSFPSGHALNSMVAAGVVVLLVSPLVSRRGRRVLWVGAGGLVILVGFSRVALGVHFVSDVAAGWLVGIGWLAVMTAAFESWRRSSGLPSQDATEIIERGVDAEAVDASSD